MVHLPHRGGASLLPTTSTSDDEAIHTSYEAIHTSSTTTSSTSQRQHLIDQLPHLRGQHSNSNITELLAQRARRCNIVSLLVHLEPIIDSIVAALQQEGRIPGARTLNGLNDQPNQRMGISQHGCGRSNGSNVVVHPRQQLPATTCDRLQPHLQPNAVPRCIDDRHDPTSSHQESHQRMAQPVSSWHLQRVLQQQRRRPQQVASTGYNISRQHLEPTRINDGSSNIRATGCNNSSSISSAGNISTSSVSLSQPASSNDISIWHVHHHQPSSARHILRHQVQALQRRQRQRGCADGQHQRLSSNSQQQQDGGPTCKPQQQEQAYSNIILFNNIIEVAKLNAATYGSAATTSCYNMGATI